MARVRGGIDGRDSDKMVEQDLDATLA